MVNQFARVSQHAGFVYCNTIMETNKRVSKSTTQATSNPTSSAFVFKDAIITDLNTFFPFDPYRLPLSCSYLDGIYRDWGMVALDDEDDDDDEDEEEDVVEELGVDASSDSGSDVGLEIQPGRRDDDAFVNASLGVSFGAMSISPVHSKSILNS